MTIAASTVERAGDLNQVMRCFDVAFPYAALFRHYPQQHDEGPDSW